LNSSGEATKKEESYSKEVNVVENKITGFFDELLKNKDKLVKDLNEKETFFKTQITN
jgi:hypothetical protein